MNSAIKMTSACNIKKKILLIGAGPTSSLISFNLRKNTRLKESVDIHVWEKANGIGGRFATSRSQGNPACYLDLGAQYLTQSLDNPRSKSYFEELKQNNLLRPLETDNIPGFRPDKTKAHFACVNGTGSVVKHFFERASISRSDILFNRQITKIVPIGETRVEVSTAENEKDSFDLVVSTIPASQLLQLENLVNICKDDATIKNLEKVKYSSRFAMGLFFNTSLKLNSNQSQPFNFVNDETIRYWSVENLKRNGSYDQEPTSVVVHTSVGYGVNNLSKSKEEIKPELLQKVVEIIPEAKSISSTDVKCHKWRYSQVMEPYIGQPGCLKINDNFIAAGDGFASSGFEGCIESAEKTADLIEIALQLK